MRSVLRCLGICADFPDGRRILVADIQIDCPSCGVHRVQIAGHHLRQIRDGLIELIDLYPDLTQATVERVERSYYNGRPPDDPSQN